MLAVEIIMLTHALSVDLMQVRAMEIVNGRMESADWKVKLRKWYKIIYFESEKMLFELY